MNVIGLTVLSRQRYVVAYVTIEYVIKTKLSKHGSWDGLSMTCFTTCNLKIILDRKSNEKNHQDPFWINLLKVNYTTDVGYEMHYKLVIAPIIKQRLFAQLFGIKKSNEMGTIKVDTKISVNWYSIGSSYSRVVISE